MSIELIEGRFQPTEDRKNVRSKNGIVVTAFPDATLAGTAMLEKGGNAVDAAVAAAFALSVCEPQSSGLGGQTMAMVHINARTFALDGSSRVPSLAHISNFRSASDISGYAAATVPSTPATLGYLHLSYGRLDWRTVLEPAIRIAREGYQISPLQHSHQKRDADAFLAIESRSGARYFLKNGKKPFSVGDVFVQNELADVLEILSDEGPRAFYLGDVARKISRDMAENGGFIRSDDLALIPWPIERKPLVKRYRFLDVHTMPPPAAGRTLLLVLMMLNYLPSSFLAERSSKMHHVLAETFRKAFLQQYQNPIDPNFYPQAPDRTMAGDAFARELIASIQSRIDPGLPLYTPVLGGRHTTHLSVMDEEGNAVGLSQSIESIYGSKAAADGLGFIYNNYLKGCETRDPSHPHFLRPGAVPNSSLAPAILFYRDKPWLVVGGPGSERIYSSVSQFLVHMIDGTCSMPEAVDRPRLHCAMGGRLSIEAGRFPPEVTRYLDGLGYEMDIQPDYAFFMGAIYAALRCSSIDEFQGAAEARREGMAAGPA